MLKCKTKGTTYLVVIGLRRLKELPFQSKDKSPESSTKEEAKARKERANQPSFFETFEKVKPVEKKKVEISCEEKFVAYTHKGGEGFEILEEMLIESFGA